MNEIKETLSVLKTRWFEAFCIVVPWAVFIPLVGLFEKIHPLKGTEAIFVSHIYLLTYICLSLFILLIKGGFLRTVYIEQKKRQSISNLTKAGKHFFSRLLRFYILYAALLIFASYLTGHISKLFTDINQVIYLHRAAPVVARLLFIKPIVLAPAIIIVLDCELFKSFSLIRQIKLLKARPLLAVSLIWIFLPLFFPGPTRCSEQISCQHLIRPLLNIVVQFVSLFAQIMAVRFVALSGLHQDKPSIFS